MAHGLLPEAHGQNLFIAVTPDLQWMGKFYYRDFDGLLIDWALRRTRQLSMPLALPGYFMWNEAYAAIVVGAPYWDALWWKLEISWRAFAKLALSELNQCMITWRRNGLLAGPELKADHFTALFSDRILGCLEELSGAGPGDRYNICNHPTKFTKDLLMHRTRILRAYQGEVVHGDRQIAASAPIRTRPLGLM